jgi:hypothetical protein
VPDLAGKLDKDSRLHDFAKAILKGEEIKNEELEKFNANIKSG